MAFPQSLTAYTALTDNSTVINAALLGQYRTALIELEKLNVGPGYFNMIGRGCDPTGAADSSAITIAAIAALGAQGGTLDFGPGKFRMDSLVKVPSRVKIKGAGLWATEFFAPASSPDIYMFETDDTTENPTVNVYGQTFGQCFEGFQIRDRATPGAALTLGGRSEDHHGILIHDSDNGIIRDVDVRELRGCAINFENVAREWSVVNSYVHGCGDSAESIPAVNISASSGDATNTIFFHQCRVLMSEYRGVQIHGTIAGIRLINFVQCQFEHGGAGSGASFGDSFPHDVVWIGRAQNASFIACNFSNPGDDKWLANLDGHADLYRVDFHACRFSGQNKGGAIRLGTMTSVGVSQCLFDSAKAGFADYYVETTAGVIYADTSNVHSANPTAGSPAGHFRGRVDQDTMNYGDNIIEVPGGGIQSLVAGKPPDTMATGSAMPNGLANIFDISNFTWWERPFYSGIGDIWMPRPGQVVRRQGEQGFASDTNERTVFTYTIPQNYLTAISGFEVEVWGEFSGTGVGSATLRIKIGGTTVFQDASAALVSGVQLWHVRFVVRNMDSVAVQRTGGISIIGAVSAATTGAGDMSTDEINSNAPFQASSTIDFSSAARAIEVSWQHSAAKVTTIRHGFGRYV